MEEDPGVEEGSQPVMLVLIQEEALVGVQEAVIMDEAKPEAAAAETTHTPEEQPTETENKEIVLTKEEEKAERAQEEESVQTIEECDTGGDEVPNVCELTPVQDESILPKGTLLTDAPIVLTIPDTVPPTQLVVEEEQTIVESSDTKPQSEVVAIDDDDDDDVEDDDDDDDEDDDDDDEGASNEAMNDDDEEVDRDIYDNKPTENVNRKPIQPPHPLDDFDDDYEDMEDDDDEMLELKEAVVISSSDEDEDRKAPPPVQKIQSPVRKYENVDDDELDYDDDDEDDDDDYDDDDLMNAVVTSATKALSSSASSLPPKKQQRIISPNTARQKEANQISVLSRRINYGRIAKKKTLNWLYTKKKREAYKSILPRCRSGTTAMRSDQSGGLLHLKIAPPSVTSIGQKPLIKPSASTPLTPRIESRVPSSTTTTTPQKAVKEEYVIDLDSSPEKSEDNSIPRRQSDDQRNSETNVKKPPDNKELEAVEEQSNTMQQTDKVRDSIQKSTEQVEESKSVAILSCEQNKENLQSNEVLKKDKDEVAPKPESVAEQPKESSSTEEAMDTAENTGESTLKPLEFTIAAVTSLNVNIKEEQPDKAPTPPPTTEEIAASKVTVEDVQERDTPAPSATPQPVSVGASKRRRSSSSAHDKARTPKPTLASDQQDDDEDYIHPTKKLREELQSNYPAHDRILNEYIEKTSNDSIDTIQRHIEQMLSEIHTLNDMIKAKEVEWNNMLHLKKVKEEICFRLTRRKQCMEIMATKVGDTGHSAGLDEDYLANESTLALGKSPPQQQNPQLSSTPIQAAINSLSSNICNFTAVSSSSSSIPTTAQLIIQNRANMKSSDLVKEKANTQRLHRLLVSRNILPKPTAGATASPSTSSAVNNQQIPSTNGPSAPSSSNQPILTSYLASAADSVQQLVDMMNGHHNNHSGLQNGAAAGGGNNSQAAMVGRQGPFKDVRSIIADFRQQHPEAVPRRGRRVKNSNNSNLSDSNTILGNALKSDTNSRPSSNDSSSHSMSNTNQASSTNHNNVNSFKDVLAPFAKSQGATALRSTSGQQQNPPYPEVTLHPVSTPLNASGGQDQLHGSLLHGILTKVPRPNESVSTKSVANQTSNYISNFSPTLARLLTAPERISASGAGSSGNQGHHNLSGGGESSSGHHSGFGVNLSKVVGHNSEITITPVMNSMHQQSMLQQQLQQQQFKDVLTRAAAAVSGNNVKDEHFLKLSNFAAVSAGNDDDAEDSVDRLVIDEGVDSMVGGDEHQRIAPHAIGQEFNENEVPVCQGCKKHEAQFVCAGCGNQWYCSRECQVTAWDDHSEVCTATKQIRNKFNILKSRDLVRGDEYYIVRRRKRNKFYPQFY